jgi:hypothetical protein
VSTFKPSAVSTRRYRCGNCGHIRMISTNHYGECYGQAALKLNMCPECSWKHQLDNVVWTCLETPPSPADVPEPWKTTTIQVDKGDE